MMCVPSHPKLLEHTCTSCLPGALLGKAGARDSGKCMGQSVRGAASSNNACSKVADQASLSVKGPISSILGSNLRAVAIIEVKSYSEFS